MINKDTFWTSLKTIATNAGISKVVDTYPSSIPARPFLIIYPISSRLTNQVFDGNFHEETIVVNLELYHNDSISVDTLSTTLIEAYINNVPSDYTLDEVEDTDAGSVKETTSKPLHYRGITLIYRK